MIQGSVLTTATLGMGGDDESNRNAVSSGIAGAASHRMQPRCGLIDVRGQLGRAAGEATGLRLEFIRKAIETELPAEQKYLTRCDEIHRGIRDIIELPDRIADLFVRLVRPNGGTLSKMKRTLPEFAVLTSNEIASMKAMVRADPEKRTGNAAS